MADSTIRGLLSTGNGEAQPEVSPNAAVVAGTT